MLFLVGLSKPRRNVIISSSQKGEIREFPPVALEPGFDSVKVQFNSEAFKIYPAENSKNSVVVVDARGHADLLTRKVPLMLRVNNTSYEFLLREELLPEKTPRIPRFIRHSVGLHLAFLVIGVGMSFFQPKMPQKLVFEIETTIIEKEPPAKVVEVKPEPKKIEQPKPEPKKIVEAKPVPPTPKRLPPKPKMIVEKKAPKAAPMKLAKPRAAPKKVVVAARPAPPGPPAPAAATPNPAVKALAAQKASIAKSLNFLSSSTSSLNMGQTFSKTKGSMYGSGSETTLNAKNAAVLNKLGASANMDGNIVTKGSRMVSSSSGIAGGSGKALNDVQGKVSVNNLYGGADLGSLSGGNMSLSGEGTLAQSLIEKILSKHLDKLRYCYEKALLTDAGLGGNVLMQWTISSSGAATNVKAVRSAIRSDDLHSCISREISKISFPKPDGGKVIVKFPFNFTSSSI